jgi:KUP system potassium uptake protein
MAAHATVQHDGTAETSTRQGLILGALGVVYGDIGTSPLYAVKQCFNALGAATPEAVYGVLSLITWALIVVVTLKYVTIILRADNRGEGGILALTTLALRAVPSTGPARLLIFSAGLVGAALFYGDGAITPAISVLSAVEGLNVATPLFEPYVIPITLLLLLGLFLIQRHGTGTVGGLFGPVMALWFTVLALLGIWEIVQAPEILLALNPLFGVALLTADPARGFLLLGAVVLAVTGAEALYADMGHFGRWPIHTAWLRLVFPALLLNYFGQGALLLHEPEARQNPFFHLAPDWALYPMVALAGAATIIASQAVISGAFSMTRQAILLGYLPRLLIRHTSTEEIGQIYVPKINHILLVAVVVLVLGFRSSDNLGSAYGIAITAAMAIDSVLALVYMTGVLGWSPVWATLLFGFFLTVDLALFSANLVKVEEGGWLPLAVAAVIFTVMMTWVRGRESLLAERWRDALPLGTFLRTLRPDRPLRVPGTAVFMASNLDVVPTALLHNLKHNKVLHERVVLMKIEIEDFPHVPDERRLEIHDCDHNVHTMKIHYGFMDEPDLPRALALCRVSGFHFNLMETSFFVGREKIIAHKRSPLPRWQKEVFIFLHRVMLSATEFLRIPANRVVELGGQIEL